MSVFALFGALKLTEWQLKQEEAARGKKIADHYVPRVLVAFQTNMPELVAARRELLFKDRYGNERVDAWHSELAYFLDGAVPGAVDALMSLNVNLNDIDIWFLDEAIAWLDSLGRSK